MKDQAQYQFNKIVSEDTDGEFTHVRVRSRMIHVSSRDKNGRVFGSTGLSADVSKMSTLAALTKCKDASERIEQALEKYNEIVIHELFPEAPCAKHHQEAVELTFSKLREKWYDYKTKSKQSTTLTTYHYDSLQLRESEFWDKPISEITTEDIESYRDKLIDGSVDVLGNDSKVVRSTNTSCGYRKPVSARRANALLFTASDILSFGVKRRWLDYNPAQSIDFIEVDVRDPEPFKRSEIDLLLTAANIMGKQQMGNMIATQASTGLRSGEMCGLTWENVDLDNGTLLVTQTVGSNGHIKPPKTKKSTRRVTLFPQAVEALRAQFSLTGNNQAKTYFVRTSGNKKEERRGTIVFPGETGNWMNTRQAGGKFARICKYAAKNNPDTITKVRRMYNLRHSYATSLLNAGHKLGFISQQLGHKDVATTATFYHFWFDDNNRSEVDGIVSKGFKFFG